jgi:AcrR family transcriptional regulator
MRGVAEKAQVSTRTLYNYYADKLSLFVACLDLGAKAFPTLQASAAEDVEVVLANHAAAIVRLLSMDTSLQLGMLIYREGGEFPELLKASEENQQRYLVEPLGGYLRAMGLAHDNEEALAKIYLSMVLSDWQRRITYRRPMPADAEIRLHARLATRVFLRGIEGQAGV